MKIINPQKKSEVNTRYLNKFFSRLRSVSELRLKIKEEFVSLSPDFNVGYTEGSQQAKISLISFDDLQRMYRPHSEGGTISLWCDGRTQSDSAVGGKRKQDDVSAGR